MYGIIYLKFRYEDHPLNPVGNVEPSLSRRLCIKEASSINFLDLLNIPSARVAVGPLIKAWSCA